MIYTTKLKNECMWADYAICEKLFYAFVYDLLIIYCSRYYTDFTENICAPLSYCGLKSDCGWKATLTHLFESNNELLK